MMIIIMLFFMDDLPLQIATDLLEEVFYLCMSECIPGGYYNENIGTHAIGIIIRVSII